MEVVIVIVVVVVYLARSLSLSLLAFKCHVGGAMTSWRLCLLQETRAGVRLRRLIAASD